METVRSNDMDCCRQFSNQPISLAMAYIAMQQWQNIYDPDVGFVRGTIFSELDKPFLGREGLPRE